MQLLVSLKTSVVALFTTGGSNTYLSPKETYVCTLYMYLDAAVSVYSIFQFSIVIGLHAFTVHTKPHFLILYLQY